MRNPRAANFGPKPQPDLFVIELWPEFWREPDRRRDRRIARRRARRRAPKWWLYMPSALERVLGAAYLPYLIRNGQRFADMDAKIQRQVIAAQIPAARRALIGDDA